MKGWLGGAVGTVRPVAAGAGMPGALPSGGRGWRWESPETPGSAFRKWGNWCLAVPLTAAAGTLTASRETLFTPLGSYMCWREAKWEHAL